MGNANNGGEQELVESMTRLEVGGNLVTIHMGHALDYVQFGGTFISSCFHVFGKMEVLMLWFGL